MRLQNTVKCAISIAIFLMSIKSAAQSAQYKRATKSAPKPTQGLVVPTGAVATGTASSPNLAPKKESEKLDIKELEDKYWAPKDTDFTVVQNRTYTKANRFATSLMTGPMLSDPFSEGLTTALNISYYFDERHGVEFLFQDSNLKDSDSTKSFLEFSGGDTRPDFNRDTGFYGIGYNWVPFYAKMSFLGKKIIYFDMQFTPFVGISQYQQQSSVRSPDESSFSYGLDVTQYFFFSKNWAVRTNVHTRFFKADVLAYGNDPSGGVNAGEVKRSDDSFNTQMFLMGITYFF